jgi:hypothetical protein
VISAGIFTVESDEEGSGGGLYSQSVYGSILAVYQNAHAHSDPTVRAAFQRSAGRHETRIHSRLLPI